jgi:16S rRNA (cytidine1402-2'-O)-methyltransferase
MGTLYLVATPIGNLEDVTQRAIRVLREVDRIFAEDTRRTRVLLDRYEIDARASSLHAHNEVGRIPKVLEVLDGGGSVALVSDAGTPLVSDPGERLVAAVAAAGHEVIAVPGASAVLAALAVSGLPAAPFVFLGFLPRKSGQRREVVAAYRDRPETLILFESPNRVAATLGELRDAWGPRGASVSRELTKLHETTIRGSLDELAGRFDGDVKGEITLVVAGAAPAPAPRIEDLDSAILERIADGERVSQIAADLGGETGLPKKLVYTRVLALRDSDS